MPEPDQVADLFDRQGDVIDNFIVGQAQNQVAADDQFVVPPAIGRKCLAVAVKLIPVHFDNNLTLRPKKVQKRLGAEAGLRER